MSTDGFTEEYLVYCAFCGFENDPYGMLAQDNAERPKASSKYPYGGATNFMDWRATQIGNRETEAVDIEEVWYSEPETPKIQKKGQLSLF